MQIAKVIREDFLQQNAFSSYDFNCPLYKTLGMMKCIVRFFENAKKAINESMKSDKKISWAIINNSIEKHLLELSQMKFQDPLQPKADCDAYFVNLHDEIDAEFRKLMISWKWEWKWE